jgi:hypothetical protein
VTRNLRFFLSLLLLTSCDGLRANAIKDEAPVKISCMTSEFAQQGNENWRIVTLTLANECNYNIDLNNVLIEFEDNQPIENIWFTDNDNTSYPEIKWSSQTDIHRLELVFESEPYVRSTLKPQKTIAVNYGVPLIAYASESVAVYYNRNDTKTPFSSTDPSSYSPQTPSVISSARPAEQPVGRQKFNE